MTALQAQAVQMMDGLSDEHILDVIAFIKGLLTQEKMPAQEQLSEKMRAFRELEAMHIDLPEDYDPDKERYEALREKYGPFD